MKIGVGLGTPPDPPAVWVDPAFVAQEAERLGFESFWIGEHVTSPVHCESFSPTFAGGQVPGFHDPLVALGRASAVTSRIKLGSGVTLILESHPLRIAKATASLDHLSGGRLLFGVGPGWNREERAMLGGDMQRPWDQVAESVQAIKALWREEECEFHGEFYDFPKVRCFPKPCRQPHPPIYVSGVSPKLVQRMVDWGDGWLGFRSTPEELQERMRELREKAEAAGRAFEEFEISMIRWESDLELARQYEAAGAQRFIVQTQGLADEKETTATLEKIALSMGL